MTITPSDLARLATLAALDVPADQLATLAAEVDRIVSYVGQLALGDEPADPPAVAASVGVRLRADVVRPIPMLRPLAEFAPQFRDGFFVVPRSAGHGGP